MTTLMFRTTPLDDDHTSAVARLEADLVSAAAGELHALRRRAVAAYQNALEHAAGRPGDPRWRILARIVAAFVMRVPSRASSQRATAAISRLNALVAENLD